MNFKILLLLAALSATITVGTAIKCYVCAGSENSDCAKGKSSAMAVVQCKAPGSGHRHKAYSYFNRDSDTTEEDSLKPVCLKLTETDYMPRLVARGCGLFPANIDACTFLEQNAHVTGCKSCKTDLCNLSAAGPSQDDEYFNIIE